MNKSNILCVRHLSRKNQYIIERNLKRSKLMD